MKDLRQSGRTTKCLQAACEYAAMHQSVAIFVVHSGDIIPYVGKILRNIDPRGHYNSQQRCFKLSDGGQVFLATIKAPTVRPAALFVQGYPKAAAFFDHNAVYEFHKDAIEEFHRYD